MGNHVGQNKFHSIKSKIYEYDEDLVDLLSEIERYCERHFEFKKPPIIAELMDYLENKGYLTASQYEVLLNIYYKNQMQFMPDW